MHTQDSSEHGSLSARTREQAGSFLKARASRAAKLLAFGVALTLASTAAHANLVVPIVYPAPPLFFLPPDVLYLSGGQAAQVFHGEASGTVSQIDVSFTYDHTFEQETPGPSFASDFSLIIIPPGGVPQLFGGKSDLPITATFSPSTVQAGFWSFVNAPALATFSDTVTTGLGALAGAGQWQIFIMNGYQDSPQYVEYLDIHITLEGLSTPVPEGFFAGGTLACLGGIVALLGVFRWRVRTL